MTLQRRGPRAGAGAAPSSPASRDRARRSAWAAFLGYEREAATRFAFLLAIPAVVGAGLFELGEIPSGDNAYGSGRRWSPPWSSFVVGYAVIAWLLRYVTTRSYLPFVIYRIGLGTLTLVMGSAPGSSMRRPSRGRWLRCRARRASKPGWWFRGSPGARPAQPPRAQV